MRAAVMVEFDLEPVEVSQMRLAHLGDQRLLVASFLPGPHHDRRPVCVVGADVNTAMTAQFLEPDPDVRLDVLDQVADVDWAVRIGKRGSHQNASLSHVHFLLPRQPPNWLAPLSRSVRTVRTVSRHCSARRSFALRWIDDPEEVQLSILTKPRFWQSR
jgi:hypothetical protein